MKGLYNEALELLNQREFYKACEKIWSIIKYETIALVLHVQKRREPPKDVSWREFLEDTFIKAGLDREEASKWASYYVDVRDRLYGACFLGNIYEEKEHKPLIEKAKDYVVLVEKILSEQT